jgi:acetyl esterase
MFAAAPPLSVSGPEAARAGMRLFTVDLRDASTLAPVASVEETTYPTPNGPRAARRYTADNPSGTTVLFIHGGGYVIGGVDTHDDHARLICNRTGATVFSVDYRLAPEHPFPAGWEDCVAAYEHLLTQTDEIAVAGDSAGGNLSAGVAQYAKAQGKPLKAQLLIYPGVDFDADPETYPSRLENGEGYMLTVEDMIWFRECYQPVEGDARASVILGELEGLAPAVVATAELDPLVDEGVAYAQLLEKAGVRVIAKTYPGLIHGFFGFGHISPGAQAAIEDVLVDFKELLA